MDVWLFGNPDLGMDSLPLTLREDLQKAFPKAIFTVQDPLDEWDMPKKLLIVDTVIGINQVKTFTSLDEFQKGPRVTMHDFDLGMQLAFLQKLNKLPPVTIIGVPPTLSRNKARAQIISALQKYGL
ncbi:MAG: hypothetical protein COT25_04060 [Candidatus Kerfeldbacteria bacterium CG08_land_8_20_14_0_20_42_7]|uniref:Hydrogenase maturation protease n=1 Tax=Candidatus Kerfeldbacteria bacterium CG08_land_8_20_14_0_20_42_7 TaxID=2014245 RepID=A0A2H0YS25_9BACT|nr:MAG: hypothetical protein COT25_04060 [Candidatus Kerfeldbacteria bacterium CG08_land_8_20_14_0_20_42_7]